jgi:hypothetical protein
VRPTRPTATRRLLPLAWALLAGCAARPGAPPEPATDVPPDDLGAAPDRPAPVDRPTSSDRPAPSDLAPVRDVAAPDVLPARDDVAPSDRPAVDVPAAPSTVSARNPVLAGDHPDPAVLRVQDAAGRAAYYLVATVDEGDFPIYRSDDLVRWARLPQPAFRRPFAPGGSIALNGHHYCHLWAPQLVAVRPGAFMLAFTASRYDAPQRPCPPYGEDGGLYLASSASVEGPYAVAEHPWEPLPAGGQVSTCALRNSLPRSLDRVSGDCQGTFCQDIIRLDGDVFRDPLTDRWWLSYAWFTNTPPRVDWERANHGEHASVVELDAADPWAVRCASTTAPVFLANPHDGATVARLRGSCARCGERLSFTRGRQGEEMRRDGSSWGVAEGPSLFRRGRYVYALYSGSAWDSAYYSVAWSAAPSVAELAYDNPARLVGRLLVPSGAMSFGHGSPVLGPDGRSWFYVHHRLRADACRVSGDCARDVWVTPMTFDDRGDGNGAVHLRARFPEEDATVTVPLR